jgi:hypothetical protein
MDPVSTLYSGPFLHELLIFTWPQLHFGMDDTPSPSPERKYDYGMDVTPSPSPERKYDYGMDVTPSPSPERKYDYGMDVTPSPSPERKYDYGMDVTPSPSPERKYDYGMDVTPSPSPERKYDYGMGVTPPPSPESKYDYGMGVTPSPEPEPKQDSGKRQRTPLFLPSTSSSPVSMHKSDFGLRDSLSPQPLGSSSKMRGKFHVANSYMHLILAPCSLEMGRAGTTIPNKIRAERSAQHNRAHP